MGPSEKVLDICNIFYSEQKVAGVILFLNYKNFPENGKDSNQWKKPPISWMGRLEKWLGLCASDVRLPGFKSQLLHLLVM